MGNISIFVGKILDTKNFALIPIPRQSPHLTKYLDIDKNGSAYKHLYGMRKNIKLIVIIYCLAISFLQNSLHFLQIK